MKKTYRLISITFLLSISFMFSLYLLSNDLNHKKNLFIRLFPPHPILPVKVLDIKYNTYYFAGYISNKFFLGNYASPFELLEANFQLSDTTLIPIKVATSTKMHIKMIRVSVDSPYIYLTDGIQPAILRCNLIDYSAYDFLYDSSYFVSFVPISNCSFITRTLQTKPQQYVLAKKTSSYPFIRLASNILEKQDEGLFSTNGTLNYNKDLKLLTYVYSFKNVFISIDTNLNIVSKGNTIDTNSKTQLKIARIQSDNSYTLSAPPLLVNKLSTTSGNWLFINSNLLAKNEDETSFNNASVIDVYNLKNNSYIFSFYLYNHGSQKLKTFEVYKNHLFAMYDHFIIAYDLSTKYFNS